VALDSPVGALPVPARSEPVERGGQTQVETVSVEPRITRVPAKLIEHGDRGRKRGPSLESAEVIVTEAWASVA